MGNPSFQQPEILVAVFDEPFDQSRAGSAVAPRPYGEFEFAAQGFPFSCVQRLEIEDAGAVAGERHIDEPNIIAVVA